MAKTLGVEPEQVPARCEELFNKWKEARKAVKKGKAISREELELTSIERFKGDLIEETARILKTQPEYALQTVVRFLDELEQLKQKMG